MAPLNVNWLEAVWLVVNSLGFSLALREAVINWRRYAWVEEILRDSNGRLRMARDNMVMAYVLLVPLVLFVWIGIYAAGRPGPPRFTSLTISLMAAATLINLGAIYVWARRKSEERQG